MPEEDLCMIMDDTNNFSPEEVAAFEATLDSEVVAELERRTQAILEEFYEKYGKPKRPKRKKPTWRNPAG